MDKYVASIEAKETRTEGNRVFVIVTTVQLHRYRACPCVHDDSISPVVDNDGSKASIRRCVEPMPWRSEMVVAVSGSDLRQVCLAQLRERSGAQVDAVQRAVPCQHQQLTIVGLNSEGIGDGGLSPT
jgi:hypothetical protein